jgi:hypothetical protein
MHSSQGKVVIRAGSNYQVVDNDKYCARNIGGIHESIIVLELPNGTKFKINKNI